MMNANQFQEALKFLPSNYNINTAVEEELEKLQEGNIFYSVSLATIILFMTFMLYISVRDFVSLYKSWRKTKNTVEKSYNFNSLFSSLNTNDDEEYETENRNSLDDVEGATIRDMIQINQDKLVNNDLNRIATINAFRRKYNLSEIEPQIPDNGSLHILDPANDNVESNLPSGDSYWTYLFQNSKKRLTESEKNTELENQKSSIDNILNRLRALEASS